MQTFAEITNIVNVNENNKKLNNNDNVIDNDNKYSASKQIDYIADRLVDKLNATDKSRPFLCKVAWKLPEHRIWNHVESAMRGKNPMGLFIYLCKKDGV